MAKMRVNSKEYGLLNVRKSSKKDSPILRTIPNGEEVDVVLVRTGMGKLDDGGWVNMDFIEEIPDEISDEISEETLDQDE